MKWAGHALEHHLGEIFTVNQIRFDRGKTTEGKKKPDFLFPGALEYHDESFSTSSLTILGVKSTCKDRWRQVLSEADRIARKHLLTLEPSISENQTAEMQEAFLQLVVPRAIHPTFSSRQQGWLLTLEKFIELVRDRQNIGKKQR